MLPLEPGHPLGVLTYGASSGGLSMISGAGILTHQQPKELTLHCDDTTATRLFEQMFDSRVPSPYRSVP